MNRDDIEISNYLVSRAFRLRLMILVLLCCLVSAILAKTAFCDVDNRPIVVLRIDDCTRTWLTPFVGLGGVNGLTYGKQKQIPITWAIISSMASSGESLTWTDLQDYLDVAGGEPGSHSVHHSPMSTQQDYINEITQSKESIQAHLINHHLTVPSNYQCNTFLQPGTWTGDANMDTFAKLDCPIGKAIQTYSQSMAYLGGGWTIGNPYYKYGSTYTLSIDGGISVPALNYILDVVAATPGLIYIITGHGVQETGETTAYKIPADLLKTTMDKLADLRDQNKIRLMGLDDAFHTTLSTNLNQVPDPGFELANPSLFPDPWKPNSSASLVSSGGVNNSRYCSLPTGSAVITSTYLPLAPGRYEMSWYQKPVSSSLNNALVAVITSTTQGNISSQFDINWAFFYNTSPTTWEKKTALALIPDRKNISFITFQPSPTSGYGLDNLSLVAAPIDPVISPSVTTITPSPGLCTISWHTPSDSSVTSINVRYNDRTHPINPTSGTFLCTVAAHPNTTQRITIPFDWTNKNYLFFSIFGTKSDNSFTPPDLAFARVDTTLPTTPTVNLNIDPDGTIHAQWSSTAANSQIVQYQYAVGRNPGSTNIRQWTTTADDSATITGLKYGTSVYVSVMAENTYGIWSSCGSALTCTAANISTACAFTDNKVVSVSGIVTAVFNDCCYVEDPDRIRGIKIIGNISSLTEGSYVTVAGPISTKNGERCVTRQ